MNKILRPLLCKCVLIYLDDIIVMAANFEDDLELLKEVINLLRINGSTVTLEKNGVLRNEIMYLCVKITQNGIKINSK